MDQLTEIEEKHGESVRTYLTVVYAHQVEGSTVKGWASTDDPAFITTALLRNVADFIEYDPDCEDEDDDDDGEDED